MKTRPESPSDTEVIRAILKASDDERSQIARELHDSAVQNLAALAMSLDWLEKAIDDPRHARELLTECQSLADKCVKEIRAVSYVLHPPLLDELGLESALRVYLEMIERRNGIAVQLSLVNLIGRLPASIELNAFRVIQHMLSRVQCNSGNGKAAVQLGRDNSSFEVIIRTQDNEFAGGKTGSLGPEIASLRERVRVSGGRFSIESADSGTVVRAVFPLE